MFILVKRQDNEVLLNTSHIWRIEAEYATPDGKFSIGAAKGIADVEARKKYTIFIGNEAISVPADPEHPLAKIIGDIYDKAIRIN